MGEGAHEMIEKALEVLCITIERHIFTPEKKGQFGQERATSSTKTDWHIPITGRVYIYEDVQERDTFLGKVEQRVLIARVMIEDQEFNIKNRHRENYADFHITGFRTGLDGSCNCIIVEIHGDMYTFYLGSPSKGHSKADIERGLANVLRVKELSAAA
jgi:hypothetical protein